MVPDRGFLYIEIFQKSKGNLYMASIICKSLNKEKVLVKMFTKAV